MLIESLSVKFMKSLSVPNHWTADLQLVSLSLKEMYLICLVMIDSSLLHAKGPYSSPTIHKTRGVNE
jgi:predicted lysophospholipase L1 biosynthesis ABC-type transport system permease subunit